MSERTIRLTNWRALWREHSAPLVIAALLLAAAAGAAWGRAAAPRAIVIEATPTPRLAPLAPLAPQQAAFDAARRLPGAIVCFAAPGGVALGGADAGRDFEALARDGEWALLRIDGVGGFDGAGGCWVRISDLAGVPALPTPPSAPAPAPAQPAPPPAPPEYVAIAAPAPAPPAPTLRPETAATVQTIWNERPAPASHLPQGVDSLAGCVDGCRVFVTPAP